MHGASSGTINVALNDCRYIQCVRQRGMYYISMRKARPLRYCPNARPRTRGFTFRPNENIYSALRKSTFAL